MSMLKYSAVFCIAVFSPVAFAQQQRAVNVGGATSALIMPKKARGSVILMAGGDGYLGVAPDGQITRLRGNQLVRTRMAYARRGKAVLVLDAGASLPAAVAYMAKISRPVTVVATSRGTLRAAQGIASGARPDALVLTSGLLTADSGGRQHVSSIVPAGQLPRTLVVHHRQDGCRLTLPAGVEPFVRWARGRARAVWLSGGRDEGNPCQARAYHGFNGLDGRVVSLAAGFR